MIDSKVQLITGKNRVGLPPGSSRPLAEVKRKDIRSPRDRSLVLEVLDARTLLSPVHSVLPVSGAREMSTVEMKQVPLRISLPPLPVFVSLPLEQPGGNILSQTHVFLFKQRAFVANQIFQAHTGVGYFGRYTETVKSVGANASGTADDTSGAVSAFVQGLTNQVVSHGGSTTEFSEPAAGSGNGEHPAVLGAVIVKESYVAAGNHLTFTLTYATPDGFLFNEQFTLKAFRFTLPQTRSPFTLLDAVSQFELHFQVSG